MNDTDRDVIELRAWGREAPVAYLYGPCHHSAAVPVESGGEIVARLCPSCDAQLPA